MDWRIKGVIQKVLGSVPAGQAIHHALQRRVGGLADFGRECDIKVDGSNPPIGWAIVLEPDRSGFFSAHGAADLEGLAGNGKLKACVGRISAAVRRGRLRVEFWETDGAACARAHQRRRAPR